MLSDDSKLTHNNLMVHTIKEAVSHFKTKNPFTNAGSTYQYYEHKGHKFIGVSQDEQNKIDFSTMQEILGKTISLPHNNEGFVLVVGDSFKFGNKGDIEPTKAASKFLATHIDDKDIVLYGYAGHKDSYDAGLGGRRLDVNALVNNWANTSVRKKRLVANIVASDTSLALQNSNCSGPSSVGAFYLVYDEKEKGASFGDDVHSSCGLTNKKCIAFDGDVRAFEKMVNLLVKKIPIAALYNVRGEKNLVADDKTTRKSSRYFSASEFLHFLKNEINGDMSFTNAQLESMSKEYLETHVLFNSNRLDASGKQVFGEAWNKLLKTEAWKNLARCFHAKKYRPKFVSHKKSPSTLSVSSSDIPAAAASSSAPRSSLSDYKHLDPIPDAPPSSAVAPSDPNDPWLRQQQAALERYAREVKHRERKTKKFYRHSGVGNSTFQSIEPGSEVRISGVGNVTIAGPIGAGTEVHQSGMGDLTILGVVADDVKFFISGMGNVYFSRTPSQSVISNITKSGMGDIKIGGKRWWPSDSKTSLQVTSIFSGGNICINGSNNVVGISNISAGGRININQTSINFSPSSLLHMLPTLDCGENLFFAVVAIIVILSVYCMGGGPSISSSPSPGF